MKLLLSNIMFLLLLVTFFGLHADEVAGSTIIKRNGAAVYVKMWSEDEHTVGQFLQIKNGRGETLGVGQVEDKKGKFARIRLIRGEADRGLAATSGDPMSSKGDQPVSRLEEIERMTHMKLKVFKPFAVTASTQFQRVQDPDYPVTSYRLTGSYEYMRVEDFSTSSNILLQYRSYNQTLSDGEFSFDSYSAGFRQNLYYHFNDTFSPFIGAGFHRGMMRGNANASNSDISDEYLFTQFDLAIGLRVNINENFIFVAQYENNQTTIDTNYNRTSNGETETFELSNDIEQESSDSIFSLGIGIPF